MVKEGSKSVWKVKKLPSAQQIRGINKGERKSQRKSQRLYLKVVSQIDMLCHGHHTHSAKDGWREKEGEIEKERELSASFFYNLFSFSLASSNERVSSFSLS